MRLELEQLRYFFIYKDGNKAEVKNSFLSFTDKINSEKLFELEKTFVLTNAVFEDQIKGYSILPNLLKDGIRIFDKDGNEVFLKEAKPPMIQGSDEEIEEEEYLEVVKLLKEISPVANTEESSINNGEESEIKPPEETPFVYGEAFLNAKKKLLSVGYDVIEKTINGNGIGYFYKKGSGYKIIIDRGEKIEVLNNVSEFFLGETTVKITGDYEQFSYEVLKTA